MKKINNIKKSVIKIVNKYEKEYYNEDNMNEKLTVDEIDKLLGKN